jgi:GDP-4-dehydro-6-deoxy-D-mannose reductase
MHRILVTGATGFIGKPLVEQLQARGAQVFPVSSRNGDIADPETWNSFQKANFVIHLAARTFVPDSWIDPTAFLKTNCFGTTCALDYCRKNKSKLIFISSYLYGNPESLPISEDAKIYANNPYTFSKIMAEESCRFYTENYGVKVSILRPFNVYGPGQNDDFLIPSIIRQIMAGKPVHVKDLYPKRDYVYVQDIVDAIIKSISLDENFNLVNIGTGKSYSVKEVIGIIQAALETNTEILSSNERRPGEVMDTQADISKAQKILGWSPLCTLEQGIAKMVETYKK